MEKGAQHGDRRGGDTRHARSLAQSFRPNLRQALHDLEDTVTQTEGIEGIALRYGFFYGPGSGYAADGHFAREVRRRRLPVNACVER